MNCVLELKNLGFVYGKGTPFEKRAVDNVSLTIKRGEFIGVIGHTGSGKSTLMQMLNGLLQPSSGHIYYNGEDIHGEGFDKKKLRSKVGLVFQYPEHQLFEETVLSDVMFGPRNLGLSEEECRKRATEALRHVGMEERYFEQSPFDLSGGQKRRAAIAGVLAMRPEILVLDEPTAGLDPRGRDEILGLITDMKKQLHMTILLVSHSMDDVARYADRIMVMRRGKLVYNDVPAEIFKHSAELEEMGLSAPQITYIMEYLQTRGLRVNADMLTVEEAAAEILKHRGELHV